MSDLAMGDGAPAAATAAPPSVSMEVAPDSATAAASSSTVAAPSALPTAAQPTLPHPPAYYAIPSATHNALLPVYTPEQLAELDALPPDASGYVRVQKRYMVNPRGGGGAAAAAAAAVDSRDAKKEQQPSLSASSTQPQQAQQPPPAAAAAASEDDARKVRKILVGSTAPSVESALGVGDDEFDQEEAAGAQEAATRADAAPSPTDPNASTIAVPDVTMLEAKDTRPVTPPPQQTTTTTTTAGGPGANGSDASAMTDVAASSSADASSAGGKNKRKRGQNKAHEREIFNARRDGPVQLCRATAAGETCTRANCKFSHDVATFAAARGFDYAGPCPLWAKYGACQAGLMCKYATSGHQESMKPTVLPAAPFTTPLSYETNIPTKDTLQDLSRAGLGGPLYEKVFPRTSALMKRQEVWKKKFDAMRDRRQREKQQQQKDQTKQMKVAREAALVAKNQAERAAALAQSAALAAAAATTTTTTDTAPTPVMMEMDAPTGDAPAAASFSTAKPSSEAAAAGADSSAAVSAAALAAATAAADAAAAADAFAAASAAVHQATIIPPTFVANSRDQEVEIAALKAQYTPTTPHRVDPFQIVSEAYTDWSSGVILIDVERKPFDFRDKLYLAPLTTVGNLPFRLVCREFGCDVTIGEMAMCASLAKGSGSEWALLRRHKSEKYFGVQLAGAFSDQVARACEAIRQVCQVDFVDFNIGCPIDQVTDKGMGSALMQAKRSKNLEPILRTMTSILDCPATLKMRMGWSLAELNCMDLLPIASRCGMAAVTVHGRTRQQRYTKSADRDYIKRAATYAKEKLNNLPVIANGDVYTFQDYEELVNPESDVTTTMIARGALVKPSVREGSCSGRALCICLCWCTVSDFAPRSVAPLPSFPVGCSPRSRSVARGTSLRRSAWTCCARSCRPVTSTSAPTSRVSRTRADTCSSGSASHTDMCRSACWRSSASASR